MTGAEGRQRGRNLGFLVAVLAIIFAAETGLMTLLPSLIPPGTTVWVEGVLDPGLLTLITAPVLWWTFIGPLRAGAATERTRSELALWGGDLGLWDWDLRTGHVARYERWAQMLGYSLTEVEASIHAWEDLIHPDDRPMVLETVQANLEGRIPSYRVECRLRTKSGGWKWILDSGKTVERDARGTPLRAAGTHLDVDERKRAERALADSERLLREAAEHVPGLFFLASADGREGLFVNHAWEEIVGRSPESFYENPLSFLEAVHPEDRGRVEAALAALLRSGVFREEHRIVRPDGSVRWVLARVAAVRGEGGEILRTVGAVQDITELKRAEEALRGAHKLESLGILAGGVAHDFNNLLAAILGNVSIALTKLPPHSPARPNIDKAVAAVQRAADLAGKMLAYSGRSRFEVRALDLTGLVRENRGRYEEALPPNVRLALALADGLPPIEADADQLRQALMNLVLNAAEAIGECGGTVTVSTRNGEVLGWPEDEALWQHTSQALEPGRYVIAEVRDDGCGMDAATIPLVFDPFFSTKFTGRGLGLAAVLGIVRGHRGGIAVESEPGRGSVFTLAFPAASPSVGPLGADTQGDVSNE